MTNSIDEQTDQLETQGISVQEVEQVLEVEPEATDNDVSHRSKFETLFPSRIAVGLLLAFVTALLISVLLEQYFILGAGDEYEGKKQTLVTWKTLVSFTREFSFATAIAYLIIITVETRSRQEIQELLEESQTQQTTDLRDFIERFSNRSLEYGKDITRKVFDSVLERDLPRGYAKSVVDTAIAVKFIRRRYHTNYVLSEFSGNELSEAYEELKDRLKLKITFSYSLQNVSRLPESVEIRISIPIPQKSNVGKFAELRALSIDGDDITLEELLKNERSTGDGYFKTYIFIKEVPAGELVEVHGSYIVVKERSDNELWTTIFPTLEASLDVKIEVPGLRCGVRANHPDDARQVLGKSNPIGEAGEFKWLLPEKLLPYQGCIFWWEQVNNTENENPETEVESA